MVLINWFVINYFSKLTCLITNSLQLIMDHLFVAGILFVWFWCILSRFLHPPLHTSCHQPLFVDGWLYLSWIMPALFHYITHPFWLHLRFHSKPLVVFLSFTWGYVCKSAKKVTFPHCQPSALLLPLIDILFCVLHLHNGYAVSLVFHTRFSTDHHHDQW